MVDRTEGCRANRKEVWAAWLMKARAMSVGGVRQCHVVRIILEIIQIQVCPTLRDRSELAYPQPMIGVRVFVG